MSCNCPLSILQMLSLYSGCEVLGYVKSVQDVGTDAVDLDAFTREQVGRGAKAQTPKLKDHRYDLHVLMFTGSTDAILELQSTQIEHHPGRIFCRVADSTCLIFRVMCHQITSHHLHHIHRLHDMAGVAQGCSLFDDEGNECELSISCCGRSHHDHTHHHHHNHNTRAGYSKLVLL